MKIIKYQKGKGNLYKVITDKKEYKLYDDIIVKHSLLLKKEISDKKMQEIIAENNLLASYYEALKIVSKRMRTEKELTSILKKKGYLEKEIKYAILKLQENGYLKHEVYIEAYIHDMLNLYLVGEKKIESDLIKLGFKESEVKPFLSKVEKSIYLEKIKKYIDKKAKVNKKSANEFKKKTMSELINKGFYKEDILEYLETVNIEEHEEEIEKLVNKLYKKYSLKYDAYTTINKIKAYLYSKGYSNIDIDKFIK